MWFYNFIKMVGKVGLVLNKFIVKIEGLSFDLQNFYVVWVSMVVYCNFRVWKEEGIWDFQSMLVSYSGYFKEFCV